MFMYFKPRFMLWREAVTVILLKYCLIHVVMAFISLTLALKIVTGMHRTLVYTG